VPSANHCSGINPDRAKRRVNEKNTKKKKKKKKKTANEQQRTGKSKRGRQGNLQIKSAAHVGSKKKRNAKRVQLTHSQRGIQRGGQYCKRRAPIGRINNANVEKKGGGGVEQESLVALWMFIRKRSNGTCSRNQSGGKKGKWGDKSPSRGSVTLGDKSDALRLGKSVAPPRCFLSPKCLEKNGDPIKRALYQLLGEGRPAATSGG